MLLKLLKLWFVCAFINCFNLDTDFPIVYFEPRNNATIKGSSKSYFGYSVVIYPGNINNSRKWIKIGAPKASTTILNTGVVYDCSIQERCKPVALPNYDGRPKEIWEDNFIGGTMDISYKYDKMTICGFRKVYLYDELYTDHKMMGACYWSSLNTSIFHTIDLLAFDQLNTIRSHSYLYYLYYGQGQAGFSAHFPMEHKELILGAPGIFKWAGAPLRVHGEEYFNSMPRGQSKKNTTKPSKYVDIPTDKFNQDFDLLGYSVSSGYFHEENELLYVTSSPRGSFYMGKVLLFEFMKNNSMSVKETLDGHQFGEYFGASLSSGRINGDNLDDLIVGAPFHKGNSFNEGKVYIYFGSKGNLREYTSLEENHLNGQFGSAVMFLGDLDNDGFGDVAIGAPYENGESGVVYIYNGNNHGLRKMYSQKINGKDIMSTLKGFGISISRAIDIDRNKFNDVAVGAHISGNAVLLRSHPAAIIENHLNFRHYVLGRPLRLFRLEICFRYSMFENETLGIIYKLAVDKALGRTRVVGYTDSTVMAKLIITRRNGACLSFRIFLNGSDNLKYPVTAPPVIVSLSYKLNNRVMSNSTSEIDDRLCSRCPVLDTFHSSKTHREFAIPFSIDCGDDEYCVSRLNFDIDIPELSNGEPYIVGSKPYLKLEANIKNEGKNAYATKLEIVLPNTIHLRNIPPICSSLNASSIICSVADPLQENKTKIIELYLDVKNITRNLSSYELPISARVLTTSINTNEDTFIYQLKVINEAHITIDGKYEQNINYFEITNTELSHIYKVEKTNLSPLEEITVKIEIPRYYIASTTKIPFVHLYEPKATLSKQAPRACWSNFTYISEERAKTEGIQEVHRSGKRIRQEVFPNISQIRRKENIKLKDTTFYINCSMNTVICSEIQCTFGPFHEKTLAVIEIKMILNISAIINSIGDNETVIFSTRGDVNIDNPQNFTYRGNGSNSFIISSIFISGKTRNAGTALWIIIVAVIAGLLLLSLLVLTLVKVGFFKRAVKEELEKLKAAHEENNYESIDDLVEGSPKEVSEPFPTSSSKDRTYDEIDPKYYLCQTKQKQVPEPFNMSSSKDRTYEENDPKYYLFRTKQKKVPEPFVISSSKDGISNEIDPKYYLFKTEQKEVP